MLPQRIRIKLESALSIPSIIDTQKYGTDWSKFTRTIYIQIAKKINQKVTTDVVNNPILVEDNLLIGSNELDRIFRKEEIETIPEFIEYLLKIPKYRAFNWISGKTLQTYWTEESVPKEKKLNVLLTFLGIGIHDWDRWKSKDEDLPYTQNSTHHHDLIKKYYLGTYYRYYQKTDSSETLIKVPFTIYEDAKGHIVAESKTVGHRYSSTYIEMRDGALYIHLKNLNWDEYEYHIINVGFATSPSLLMGTSNSLNNKKQALCKRNIFVLESQKVDFESVDEEEISFDRSTDPDHVEYHIQQYFKKNNNHLILSTLVLSVEDLK